MRRLILPEDMRACEARYFEATGVKSIDAMERASEALADVVRETVPAGGQVIFVCGSGGNGGAGWILLTLAAAVVAGAVIVLGKFLQKKIK